MPRIACASALHWAAPILKFIPTSQKLLAFLERFGWWVAVCIKKTTIYILLFVLGKNYFVIHFESKYSVRMGVLFWFVVVSFYLFICGFCLSVFNVAFRMWFDTSGANISSLRNAQCFLWSVPTWLQTYFEVVYLFQRTNCNLPSLANPFKPRISR